MIEVLALVLVLACCSHDENIRTFFAVLLFLLTIAVIIGMGVLF